MKSAGSSWVGEAGWACGVWSTEAIYLLVLSLVEYIICRALHGMVRLPKNLIIGVRSAWTAADEARRARVANIFKIVVVLENC